jgi:hypothetical protein
LFEFFPYFYECGTYFLKVFLVIGCFGIFFEFCLYLMYVGFESLTYQWEIDQDRQGPSYECDHDSGSDECPKSTRNTSDKIRPEHLPGGSYILYELFESDCFDRINESFYIFTFFLGHVFDDFFLDIGESFYLRLIRGMYFFLGNPPHNMDFRCRFLLVYQFSGKSQIHLFFDYLLF